MFTTRPQPRSTIPGSTARVVRRPPLKLMSITRSQNASSVSRNGLASSQPALFTRMSTGPTCSTAAATDSESVTSSFTAIPSISRAAAWASCSSRSATTTLRPSAARATAIPRPIPRAPPVTIATLTADYRSPMNELTDVNYEVENVLAWITIDRPERMNAFRARTVDELIHCFKRAWASSEVGVVCLTGAGDRAFSTGGDQKQRAETGDYGPSESGLFEVEYLHRLIREIPKPVIAAVNGYAVGGGHVLHVLCDLSIAADTAVFGQTGPRVGSVDAGFGSAYLARVVGEKRAREIWFLCRRYDADTAERWGLVNQVVPKEELREAVRRYADEILALSPTALRFLKQSFNVDTEHLAGVGQLAFSGLEQFVDTPEGREGAEAYTEKRPPDFRSKAK